MVGVHVVPVNQQETIELPVVPTSAVVLLPVCPWGGAPEKRDVARRLVLSPCAPQHAFAVEAVVAEREPALHQELPGSLLDIELVVVQRPEGPPALCQLAQFWLARGFHGQDHLVGRLGKQLRYEEAVVESLDLPFLDIQKPASVAVDVPFAPLHLVPYGLAGAKEQLFVVEPGNDSQLHSIRVHPERFLGQVAGVVDLGDGVAIPGGNPQQGKLLAIRRERNTGDHIAHRPLLEWVGCLVFCCCEGDRQEQ